MREWISENQLPLISLLGAENFGSVSQAHFLESEREVLSLIPLLQQLTSGNKHTVVIVTDPLSSRTKEYIDLLLPIAKAYRTQFTFANIDGEILCIASCTTGRR